MSNRGQRGTENACRAEAVGAGVMPILGDWATDGCWESGWMSGWMSSCHPENGIARSGWHLVKQEIFGAIQRISLQALTGMQGEDLN